MFRSMNLWGRLVSRRSAAARPGVSSFEGLEDRKLMAAGPRVVDVFADNRGLVTLRVDRALDPATVNKKSAQIFVNGQAKKAGVSYNKKALEITINAKMNADQAYMIYLNGNKIRDKRGYRLDGEFAGAGKPTGNGKAGGDFKVTTKASAAPVARFTTIFGNVDVQLFKSAAPNTVNNFLSYANGGEWDGTFFHRSVDDFVIQGGGFKVNRKEQLDFVADKPAIDDEPDPTGRPNKRGTIAMARSGSDTATNQWFFNVVDNDFLDGQNGGIGPFSVFGEVTSKRGMKIVDKINALPAGPLLPSNSPYYQTFIETPGAGTDLVVVSRIAARMDVVAPSKKRNRRAAALDPAPVKPAAVARGTFAASALVEFAGVERGDAVFANADGALL